jgi:hypothetical protein
VLTRREFDIAVTRAGLDQPPDDVWGRLVRVAGGPAPDRSRLRAAVVAGRLPDELTATVPARITVSSIHRAKGLEYDRVLVAVGGVRAESGPDVAEECRILYVAMTRARDELFRVGVPKTSFPVRKCKPSDRWARYGFKKWQRLGLELDGRDVHQTDPAGTLGFTEDPVAVQLHLQEKVTAGDEVRIEAEGCGVPGVPPVYTVHHLGQRIGVLSATFAVDLERYLSRGKGHEVDHWPRAITGARVEAVETVGGDGTAGLSAGLGEHGVWLAPRLGGLTWFTYGDKDGATA